MSHVPEHIRALEDSMKPSPRIADDPHPTVFDTLGRLRTLTANATVASIDEGIEMLLQSVQQLRSLHESLCRVASIKHRLMNIEVHRMLGTSKQPVSSAPTGNLIPFPGPTKRRGAGEIPRADSFHPQGTVKEEQPTVVQAATAAQQQTEPQDSPDKLTP